MSGVNRKPRLDRRRRAGLPDHVIALAWSPHGKHVAAAAVSGPVAVIDAGSGAVRHTLPGHGFGPRRSPGRTMARSPVPARMAGSASGT